MGVTSMGSGLSYGAVSGFQPRQPSSVLVKASPVSWLEMQTPQPHTPGIIVTRGHGICVHFKGKSFSVTLGE